MKNSRTIFLSSIFNWFAEDFKRTHGTVIDFVEEYLPAEEASKLSPDYSVKFTEYNWNLNDGSR